MVRCDVHELASECGVDGERLSPGALDVAEEVAFGVGGADGGFCAANDACVARDLKEDLTVEGSCDGVGLGVLEG